MRKTFEEAEAKRKQAVEEARRAEAAKAAVAADDDDDEPQEDLIDEEDVDDITPRAKEVDAIDADDEDEDDEEEERQSVHRLGITEKTIYLDPAHKKPPPRTIVPAMSQKDAFQGHKLAKDTLPPLTKERSETMSDVDEEIDEAVEEVASEHSDEEEEDIEEEVQDDVDDEPPKPAQPARRPSRGKPEPQGDRVGRTATKAQAGKTLIPEPKRRPPPKEAPKAKRPDVAAAVEPPGSSDDSVIDEYIDTDGVVRSAPATSGIATTITDETSPGKRGRTKKPASEGGQIEEELTAVVDDDFPPSMYENGATVQKLQAELRKRNQRIAELREKNAALQQAAVNTSPTQATPELVQLREAMQELNKRNKEDERLLKQKESEIENLRRDYERIQKIFQSRQFQVQNKHQSTEWKTELIKRNQDVQAKQTMITSLEQKLTLLRSSNEKETKRYQNKIKQLEDMMKALHIELYSIKKFARGKVSMTPGSELAPVLPNGFAPPHDTRTPPVDPRGQVAPTTIGALKARPTGAFVPAVLPQRENPALTAPDVVRKTSSLTSLPTIAGALPAVAARPLPQPLNGFGYGGQRMVKQF
eukprot:TRINITY_DN2009_c0_g1_i3.p1 TRINITY_DN2009_c0_g1~~TRINITY_DN2009_c0_g1_i3.p1  ORF type:complete len:587 (-),score=266.20 TRINITY_DN2009_c0_g1_i3:173-1933(-)